MKLFGRQKKTATLYIYIFGTYKVDRERITLVHMSVSRTKNEIRHFTKKKKSLKYLFLKKDDNWE